MSEFAIAEVMPGKLNALVKHIMRQTGQTDPNEAVRLVNSGEWVVSKPTRSWREEEGVIYFSVTPDSTTGMEWIMRLEYNGFRVGHHAKQVLRSPDFKPTSGVTTEVAVLKGTLFRDKARITRNIRAEADKRNLSKPNAELACLIREKFTDKEIKEMGLRCIVAMHEPVNDPHHGPILLGVGSDIGHGLIAYYGGPRVMWDREDGLAFAVSQVNSQS